jgi:hypothetical protein
MLYALRKLDEQPVWGNLGLISLHHYAALFQVEAESSLRIV